LLRNLRNMAQADVDEKLIRNAILVGKGADRVLPFRYIAAARAAPQFENVLDIALQNKLDTEVKLPGKTIILVDISGSMDVVLSQKSDMTRIDAACGVAVVVRALADSARVFSFSNSTAEVPAKHGMALADAIKNSQAHGGTWLGAAITTVSMLPHDRLIVITDEQSSDPVGNPKAKNAYMINVAAYQNGVGYGKWVHIDGFSESVIRFIQQYESEE
jgi:60 kDa SS-A/Ro ribonucleoprotein